MQVARRGRLAKIDLLPEQAWPHVKQAYQQLTENKREAEDIREELNLHLTSLGLEPITRSAFNRKSLALAKIGADIARSREMAAVFAEKAGEMPDGDVGMLINEMCKSIIFNITERISVEDMDVAAKLMKEIALATYRLEQAGQISQKRRQDYMVKARAQAAEAVKTIAKSQGITQETVNTILEKILGKPDDVVPEGNA